LQCSRFVCTVIRWTETVGALRTVRRGVLRVLRSQTAWLWHRHIHAGAFFQAAGPAYGTGPAHEAVGIRARLTMRALGAASQAGSGTRCARITSCFPVNGRSRCSRGLLFWLRKSSPSQKTGESEMSCSQGKRDHKCRRLKAPNQSRHPTPGVRLGAHRPPAAWRGCAEGDVDADFCASRLKRRTYMKESVLEIHERLVV